MSDQEKKQTENETENSSSSSESENELSDDLIQELLQLKLSGEKTNKEDHKKVLDETTFENIVKYIQSGKVKNIITMAGAGISTSAGIPDFRSPGSGLYDNLKKYKLPFPEAIFYLDYFRNRPEPFYQLAKELYPGNFNPTICHRFIKLLENKQLLLRHYTQNIDTLERVAEISEEKLVEAHGTFYQAHCINKSCYTKHTQKWVKEQMDKDVIPSCNNCNSLVKPDIVFFGENLPERYFRNKMMDFPKCDLLIILGTSLTVFPFADLINEVSPDCPRLLINLTEPDNDDLKHNQEDNYRDVALIDTCDNGCMKLAEALGWKDDLMNLVEGLKNEE